jgi:short subunit dehydrogenase-like uncharacterized protein
MELAARDKNTRRLMADAYSLVPDGPRGPDKGEHLFVGTDDDVAAVVGPFFMGPVNARVVRRSNALLQQRYGTSFSYVEQMRTGRGLSGHLAAHAVRVGMGVVVGTAATRVGRSLLRRVFPAQGTGPSDEACKNGFFSAQLHGHRHDGAHFKAIVKAQKDPGYGATGDMIVESALRLLDDEASLGSAGVTTPAAALGLPLVERLRRRGMTFDVERLARA